jgi:hypothetical protein
MPGGGQGGVPGGGGKGMGGSGMPGMPGSGMPGMPGGGMMGMMGRGMTPGANMMTSEEESTPMIATAIIEVPHHDIKTTKTGRTQITTPWGKTLLFNGSADIDIRTIPLPTVAQRFENKWSQARSMKETDAGRIGALLDLAEWCLSHGLTDLDPKKDRVTQVMELLAKSEPSNPSVVAFRQTASDLQSPLSRDDAAIVWKDRLENFKEKRSKHYVLLYDVHFDAEAQRRLDQLELNYQGFFYWFALRGQPQKLPDRRLVAVLVDKPEFFNEQHQKVFDNVPMVTDGFFARRDNLAVFSNKGLDEIQVAMDGFVKQVWVSHRGWEADELLQGKGGSRSISGEEWARAQTYTLVWKAMQQTSERAAVSFEGTRQLIAALGLLPRSVEAPQWIDFGTGSFFESPRESFWYGTGAPNINYQLNFELWDKFTSKPPTAEERKALVGLDIRPLDKAIDALRSVVTDRYFRGAQKASGNRARKDALKRAQTMTWGLTYFLAQKKRGGLLAYYAELSKLPRDLTFDEDTLLRTFARAFGLTDRTGNVDQGRLDNLANEWYQYMRTLHPEVNEALQEYLDSHKKKTRSGSSRSQPAAAPGGKS